MYLQLLLELGSLLLNIDSPRPGEVCPLLSIDSLRPGKDCPHLSIDTLRPASFLLLWVCLLIFLG